VAPQPSLVCALKANDAGNRTCELKVQMPYFGRPCCFSECREPTNEP